MVKHACALLTVSTSELCTQEIQRVYLVAIWRGARAGSGGGTAAERQYGRSQLHRLLYTAYRKLQLQHLADLPEMVIFGTLMAIFLPITTLPMKIAIPLCAPSLTALSPECSATGMGQFPICKLKWDLLRTSVTACTIDKNTFSAPFGVFYVRTEI